MIFSRPGRPVAVVPLHGGDRSAAHRPSLAHRGPRQCRCLRLMSWKAKRALPQPRELRLMDTGDAIGRRIAHARKLRGLTQIGLAGRAHVSKSLIAQVESGHKPATPSLIAAVSG